MSSNIEFDKLVSVTAELFQEYGVSNLKEFKILSKKHSIWSQLAKKYFLEKVQHKDTINIRSWWLRNANYRDQVFQKISLNSGILLIYFSRTFKKLKIT